MANALKSNLSVELSLLEVELKQNRDEKSKLQKEMERMKAQSKKRDVTKELESLKAKITKCDEKIRKLPGDIELLKRRIRNQLEKSLNIILQKIQFTNQDKSSSILKTVFSEIIVRMCNADSLFKRMYKGPYYTGSYYEKLRIKDSGDFDINLVLALPANTKTVKISVSSNKASHSCLSLMDRVEELRLEATETRNLKRLLDDQNFVLPSKVLSWIQSVMDIAQLKNIRVDGVKEIRYTAGGPARTLLIVLNDRTEISVDLVPVFRFPYAEWPTSIKELRKPIVALTDNPKRNLYLVPKCYKRGLKQSANEPAEKDKPRVWRMHFAEVETGVLERNLHARPVIKLLKLLRDSEKWHSLHSYFLKTLVLNEIAANPSKEWKQNLIPERLLEMLEKLKVCLDKKSLPHFFFPTVNLLQYMTAAEMANISQRLDKIMKLRENPNLVDDFFKV